MIALISLVALVALTSAFDNRNGRSGQLRVINLIGNLNGDEVDNAVLDDSLHSNFADDDFPEFDDNQEVRVAVDFGSGIELEVDEYNTGNVAAQAGEYKRINLEGSAQDLKITLSNSVARADDEDDPADDDDPVEEIEICGGLSISPDQRATLIIKAVISEERSVDEGACFTEDDMDNCFSTCQFEDDVVTPAQVDYECFLIKENLDAASCTDVDPVNIHRFDPLTCDQFIVRTSRAGDSTVSGDEVVQIAEALAASPTDGSPDQRSLDNSKTYTIKDRAVFTESPARVHDFFWGADGGAVFVANSLTTGRVGILHAAYRTNGGDDDDESATPDLALDSDFKYTITTTDNGCTTFLGSSFGDCVVHSGSLDALDQTDLIELEAGVSYKLNIFSDDATDDEIFGEVETENDEDDENDIEAADAITTETFTVESGKTIILVLEGGNARDSTSLDISNFDITESVDEGTTDHTIINLVQGQSFKFAQPSGDCCNFLSDDSLTTDEEQTFNTANKEGSFNAYTGTAECGSLSSSLLDSNVFSFDNTDVPCGRKVHFLTGRRVVVEVDVESDNGNCPELECTNDEVRFVSVDSLGTSNDGISVSTFSLAQCDCNPSDDEPECNACEAEEFASLAAKIDAVNAQVRLVSGTVLGSAASQDNALGKIRSDIKDLEDDVDDLGKDLSSKIDDLE